MSNVLLLILLHPILNRKIGDAYGMTMVANQFAMLLGVIVNYGTNQSGIKDVALAKDDTRKRALEFYTVLTVRGPIFAFFFGILVFSNTFNITNHSYFFLATPLVFAEVINPLFLFIGLERLSMFNLINVLIKIAIIISIVLLIRGPQDAEWVNFYIGIFHIIGYSTLIIYAIIKFGLPFQTISFVNYAALLKNNFFLVSNGVAVHLQQSFMLFALAKWGSSGWLYAYSVGDKIIWSVRLLTISITNAIYPKAALVYNASRENFMIMKTKYNRFIGLCFLIVSLIFLIFAPLIIKVYTGDENETAVLFLRLMSFSPLLAALNALNIIHLLISNQNKQILKIGILLLLTSLCLSSFAIYTMNIYAVGIYALIIEAIALICYTKGLNADSRN